MDYSFFKYTVLCKTTEVILNKISSLFGHSEGTSGCCSISVINYYLILLKVLHFYGCLNVMVVSVLYKQNSEKSFFIFKLLFQFTDEFIMNSSINV